MATKNRNGKHTASLLGEQRIPTPALPGTASPVITNQPPTYKVFVIMPSGANQEYKGGRREGDYIYKHIISRALEEFQKRTGCKCSVLRETDHKGSGSITSSIVKHIAEADISIVDITGMNPNVLFELGVRYALRRSTTILLRNTEARIPFDVTVYRAISYDILEFDSAATDLTEALFHSATRHTGDSLVYDVFPGMEVRIPGVYDSSRDITAGRGGVMPWPEFSNQLNEVAGKLKEQCNNGWYRPDVIIGISNGGLLVADLLGRELGLKIPIVSLWANRASTKIFDHCLNRRLLHEVCQLEGEKKLEILLVDDIVASGQTVLAAIDFINQVSNSREKRVFFLPLFSRNDDYLSGLKQFLFYEHILGMNEAKITTMLHTDWRTLPYNKDIRSS